MKRVNRAGWIFLATCVVAGCAKSNNNDGQTTAPPPTPPSNFALTTTTIEGKAAQEMYRGISKQPLIQLRFAAPVDRSSVAGSIALQEQSGAIVLYNATYQNSDSVLLLQPTQPLPFLKAHTLAVSTNLKSTTGGHLTTAATIHFNTGIDSTDKFPRISDDALLDLVQKQTFTYFWDFAHPVSGLARERNTSGDVVTSGGSGFGIMAMLAAINRQFITRAQGLERLQKIVGFLQQAQTFHGAFPHWLDGSTGAAVPFSQKDNGADLVETSYLMQGLLCARQYFDGTSVAETRLRSDINALWNGVEWDWFQQGNQKVLYWHWSPDQQWAINMPIRGWNEALITYVLAAASPSHAISKAVYDEGWASNGGIKNGNTYYDVQLPLGPEKGGPLFFEHYSFLGLNPAGLKDAYADYDAQTKAHAQINYRYVIANPGSFYGYSAQNWGLTASDDINGYLAHEPANDNGVISPTAALASFPYTPQESMAALKFFYYTMGDKLWKEYGFVDAFSLHHLWFADSFLAIDQGPIIVMMENYRSGLLWKLFMSCPEVKSGLTKLGFTSPHL